MEFQIKSVNRISSDTVRVVVTMDAKVWRKACKSYGSMSLGCLYGVDISNAVSQGYGVKAWNPTVNDVERASKGIKTLILFYNDTDWAATPNNLIRVDFIARKRVA